MQFNFRNAIIVTVGIFLLAVGYILYVQHDLIKLHHTHHAIYEEALRIWIFISIFITFILTSILLSAFIFIIKIRAKELQSHTKLEHLYEENRLYFDNAAIGFLTVDSQRNIINVNPMLCSIFGYKQEELISKSTEILHLDHEHYVKWGEEVFKKAQLDKVVRIRYPMHKKDGTKIYIEVSGAPFNEKQNYDGAVVWTATDVSHKVGRENIIKALNKELEKSLNYFRNMLSIAPMPIFVKDETYRYRECNDAFLKLFGKKKSEVIGKTANELFPLEIAAKIDLHDGIVMQQKEWHFTENVEINGNYYILDIHKSPIVQEEKFSGIVGIAVDVTRREEQKLYLNRRIEEEVFKNVELEKRHLEGHMNDLKFAVIGQLSAGITHEINTPLTYMKGNVEMMGYDIDALQESEIKTNLLEENVKVMEGVKRIERIIANMREMSQVSRQDAQEVDVYDTLVTALTMAENRSKHIVKISLQDQPLMLGSAHDSPYIVLAQKQRLEQAWIIIINNALDELEYNGSFEKNHFDIRCFEENSYIKIIFSDNGGGIDENIIDSVFEPFISTKEHGGIGIGLNITQKIIQDHKGKVRAYNSDSGAVFEVILPSA